MSFGDIIKTFLEFLAVIAVITGFVHEKKLIAFENKMWAKFKARKENKNKNAYQNDKVIPITQAKPQKTETASKLADSINEDAEAIIYDINNRLNISV